MRWACFSWLLHSVASPFLPALTSVCLHFLQILFFFLAAVASQGRSLLTCSVFCEAEREGPGEKARCLVLAADGMRHSAARQLCEVAAIITWFLQLREQPPPRADGPGPSRSQQEKGPPFQPRPAWPPGLHFLSLCCPDRLSFAFFFFFLRLQFKGSAPRMPSEEESLFSMGSSALEFGWRLRHS